MKTEASICPDCGRNSEFILHADGCPQFGREVDEFLKEYDAEIASWPEGARKQLEGLNVMHSLLFGKLLRARNALQKILNYPLHSAKAMQHVAREALNQPGIKPE
jgi:hypothetical protein